jgi:hypothetical protein
MKTALSQSERVVKGNSLWEINQEDWWKSLCKEEKLMENDLSIVFNVSKSFTHLFLKTKKMKVINCICHSQAAVDF